MLKLVKYLTIKVVATQSEQNGLVLELYSIIIDIQLSKTLTTPPPPPPTIYHLLDLPTTCVARYPRRVCSGESTKGVYPSQFGADLVLSNELLIITLLAWVMARRARMAG